MLSLVSMRALGAELCASQAEWVALNGAVLRAELMNAALSCGSRTEYNEFVTAFDHKLVAQGHLLQTYFTTHHGKRSAEALNRFVTRLANEESQRSTVNRGSFCRDASSIFATLSKEPQRIEALLISPSLYLRHDVTPCGTSGVVTERVRHAAAAEMDQPHERVSPDP